MRVTVTCFGAMREHLPPDARGNRAVVDVPEGATVAHVVDALGAPRRLVFAVLVDGEQAALDAPVRDGADVVLMPPFTGGAVARPRGRATGRVGSGRPTSSTREAS